MTKNKQKLFSEFAPITTEAWEAKINVDLKGADYEKTLVWKSSEGINVQPYYRQENLDGLGYLESNPGEFPFVRGNSKSGNNWFIRQDIRVGDYEQANKKALEILGKGVNSIGFCFENCQKITKEDIAILLKNICLGAAEINFVCPCEKCNCISEFVDYVNESNYLKEEVIGSSAIDPLGNYLLKGKLSENAFSDLKKLAESASELKKFRTIAVHAKNFAESGSSIIQELAFSLAQGAEYMTKLTDLGMKAEDVAKKIKFNFGISNNYFMEIAKLRAARLLWAHVVKAYGTECDCSAKLVAHSETNAFNKTIYDPNVNMLRTQTEAMSAVLGGAHSVTVLPFNAIFDKPNDVSERIARNQQILLKEEVHLDKIADPSAGSYYIETLTDSLANETWKLFLEVQEMGGFLSALKNGFIQSSVKQMAAKRDNNVASRRENLLGTNQFPNFSEMITGNMPSELFQPQGNTVDGADIETLKPYRIAQAFETLRYKTDIYSKTSKRPSVFMLTIGNLAFRKARAQFCTNFFAVAGFEVIDNNGFDTVEQGVKAAKAAKSDIVVVCSSDDEYAVFVPQIADFLDNEILVVAGNPACKPELEEKGIKNFVHVRSNLLDELKAYQSKLGI